MASPDFAAKEKKTIGQIENILLVAPQNFGAGYSPEDNSKPKTPLAASTFNQAPPPKALNGSTRMRLLNFVDLLQKSRCYHTAILTLP